MNSPDSRSILNEIVVPEVDIIKKIDAGCNGVVFLARQKMPDRDVALKYFMRKDQLPIESRFVEEINKIGSLDHENIAKIYGGNILENNEYKILIHYAIYEWISGNNLKIWLLSKPDWYQKLKILRQICSARKYAHSQGKYHGDLNHGNILVQSNNIVKIIDFGTSQFVKRQQNNPLIRESKCINYIGYALISNDPFKDYICIEEMNKLHPTCLLEVWDNIRKILSSYYSKDYYSDDYNENYDKYKEMISDSQYSELETVLATPVILHRQFINFCKKYYGEKRMESLLLYLKEFNSRSYTPDQLSNRDDLEDDLLLNYLANQTVFFRNNKL